MAVLTSYLFMCSFKGLVVDLEDGNLVKLAEDGTVLRYTVLDLLSHPLLFINFPFMQHVFF